MTDIIGLLSPTSEDPADGGSTIQWETSAEVNDMIKESQSKSKNIKSTTSTSITENENADEVVKLLNI